MGRWQVGTVLRTDDSIGNSRVPMPGRPGTMFVVIHPELRFVFLKATFDQPAGLTHAHPFSQGTTLPPVRCSGRI